MADPRPIQTSATSAPAAVPATPARAAGGGEASGARFQALLEELDLRAKAVAKSAQEPLSAASLPAAVEGARTSLSDALALSASLLEAWRQSVAQGPTDDPRGP